MRPVRRSLANAVQEPPDHLAWLSAARVLGTVPPRRRLLPRRPDAHDRTRTSASIGSGFLREPATLVDNVFDTLVTRDKDMRLAPSLALSWKALDDTS
jgi:hypothetical protein